MFDKLMTTLTRIAEDCGDATVSVGFFQNATYPDGTSVAAVAFQNEFGRPLSGQPPRPYFRQMVAEFSPGWGVKLGKAMVFSKYNGEQALGLMGEDIGSSLRKSIKDFTSPGLAKSTVAAKGFDKPLIDTDHMINSISYEVNSGGP